MPRGWRFDLVDERSPLALFRLLVLVLAQQHLAQSDPLYDALGHQAHLLALEGVVEEEYVVLLALKAVELLQFGLSDGVVILHDLVQVVFALADVLQLEVSG